MSAEPQKPEPFFTEEGEDEMRAMAFSPRGPGGPARSWSSPGAVEVRGRAASVPERSPPPPRSPRGTGASIAELQERGPTPTRRTQKFLSDSWGSDAGSSGSPSPNRLARANSEDAAALERALQEIATLRNTNVQLSERQRMVESQINPDDLEPYWEDREAGHADWRKCLVSGAHLPNRKGGGDGGCFAAQGAQGEVYRATWKSSIPVAIKENRTQIHEDLTDEMQLFLDLHHPHVVACYGILKERVESEDGASSPRMKNSIVTERCRKPLDHFLAEHSEWMGLGGDEIDLRKYTILHHVSLGLQKLHDMGVLHRDIKGGNLLLDGVPKTCDTCQHAGKWKICDFGEAKVLKRPSLQFSDAQPWPKGWSGSLSYQPITSPFLRDQGARHYCWLPSGQVLEPATNHDPPPTPKNCGRNHAITNDDHRWTPCPHSGGFVYSFSEDPSHHDARDCFFSLSGVTGDTTSANLVPFPKSLGPFGLSPTELLPVVDFESLTYQLRSTLYQNPQLQLLKTMLPEGGTIEGKISPPCRITLSDSERRQALIPPGATHFAWAYQAVDLEELSAEQNKQLEKDSGEMLFVSLGGFLYFDSVEVGDDRDTIRYGSVIKANAIGAGLGLKCRIGTIDRPEDDDNLTATIASPEMFEGKGIGLETDVFAFGVVMWEVFTRREVWHWITGKEKRLAIMNHVADEKLRPKVPEGLSARCALMLRQCLHHDPSKRPRMKEVTQWLEMCRRKLLTAMAYSRNEKIKECTVNRGTPRKVDRHNITEQNASTKAFWSDGGRFSRYPCSSDRSKVPRDFHLKVSEVTQDQWMENALLANEPKPKPFDRALPPIFDPDNPQKFGLIFKRRDGKGGMENLWQAGNVRVARVDQTYKDKYGVTRPTVASQYPEIRAGSRLLKINGEDPPPTFKEAIPAFKKLPLVLHFAGTIEQAAEDGSVPSWLLAGLAEIELVRRHEAAEHCNYDAKLCKTCSKSRLVRNLSSGWSQLSGHSPRGSRHTSAEAKRMAVAATQIQVQVRRWLKRSGYYDPNPPAEIRLARCDSRCSLLQDEIDQLEQELEQKKEQLRQARAEKASITEEGVPACGGACTGGRLRLFRCVDGSSARQETELPR